MLALAVTVLQWYLAKESRASLAVSNELKNIEIAYIGLQLVLGNHFQGVPLPRLSPKQLPRPM